VPIDLEVVMVRPRWLCGTFGFHPMLGFRREKQAESIAHGCATGLLELTRTIKQMPQWAKTWGIKPEGLPLSAPANDRDPIEPGVAGPGRCWFRPGVLCTFSTERLKNSGLPQATIDQVNEIHAACGRPETHRPRRTVGEEEG
jgi:hypothetical protein